MGRTELPRQFQFVVENVHSDNRLRTGENRTLYAIEPHATTPENRYRTARLNFGSVDNGTDSSHDTAPDKGGLCEWHIFINADNRILRDYRICTERAQPYQLVHHRFTTLKSRTTTGVRREIAQVRKSLLTHFTTTTTPLPCQDDVVSLPNVSYPTAHLFDNARAFVPENGRDGNMRPVAFNDMPIRVTDTTCRQSYPYHSATRFRQFKFLDLQRCIHVI